MRINPRLAIVSVAALTTLALAPRADAWGNKEHIQFTRLAAMRIIADPSAPEDLKAWLKANTTLLPSMDAEKDYFLTASFGRSVDPKTTTGLTWWAVVPDVEANDRTAGNNGAFGNRELTSHYIDMEFGNTDVTKRTYQLDGSSLPPASAFVHDITSQTYVRGGYLPWARENAYHKFVDAIRAGKLEPDPAKPDDKENAVRWGAYLAHYTQDNTQPQHATADYQSAQYFKGTRNPPNVHSEVEYRMADDATQPLPELRAEFWPLFVEQLDAIKDPTLSDDAFASTIEVSRASYLALPLIGEAAKQAVKQGDAGKPEIDTTKFFHYVGTVDGKQESVLQMKAYQTAWAVVRTERVIKQAWAEAHQPATAPTTNATTTQPTP